MNKAYESKKYVFFFAWSKIYIRERQQKLSTDLD